MKILIVDDNEVNVKLYEQVITWIPQAESVCFTDAVAALKWCRTELPALAVVDYRMPQMDGLEFIKQFRRNRKAADVPVIMLTAVDSAQLRDFALSHGATYFLTKPVDKDRFVAAIEHYLANSQALPGQ